MRPAAAAASSAFFEISWYDRSRILPHKGQSSGQLNARPKKRGGEGGVQVSLEHGNRELADGGDVHARLQEDKKRARLRPVRHFPEKGRGQRGGGRGHTFVVTSASKFFSPAMSTHTTPSLSFSVATLNFPPGTALMTTSLSANA